MGMVVNNLMNILIRRISQIPIRAKTVNQKRIFTLYLIKKTQAKIRYLNNLIAFAVDIGLGRSKNTKKQVNIIIKIINLQKVAVNIYIARTI